MLNFILILLGKFILAFSKITNLGSGSTWPGHIALNVNKNFIKQTVSYSTKIIIVVGTNGKTTTSTFITHILEKAGFKVAQNNSGANLLNGVASTIISNANLIPGKLNADYLVLEIDENSLPEVLSNLNSDYIIALDLFRDQLDRYGEINSISKKWGDSFEKINKQTIFILNADDPQIAFLGNNIKNKVSYFGLVDKNTNQVKHGADSIYCPKCFTMLSYKSVYFSHLGDWSCPNCKLKRPKINLSSLPYYPLPGLYNKYNFLAGVLLAKEERIKNTVIAEALQDFKPAFGRQEEFEINNKKVKIFLSKNPTSFNESLYALKDLNANNILIVLNDQIPDGRDVSWIWDTRLSPLSKIKNISVSGERCFDFALRLKYEDLKYNLNEDLKKALQDSLSQTEDHQTLYILPTYSAMLDVRKILGGRKIL